MKSTYRVKYFVSYRWVDKNDQGFGDGVVLVPKMIKSEKDFKGLKTQLIKELKAEGSFYGLKVTILNFILIGSNIDD